ncbi:MAG: cation transporter [Oscillospiraceae bacterium]|nr:cation transporter [Oscillospiraceae bacterium]
MHSKSGSRTLLWSVIMSAPGPLVMGFSLLAGQSSTQIADFFRRSAELMAIIMSFIIYQITTEDTACDKHRKVKLERFSNLFVGIMMCVGGLFMGFLTLTSSTTEKGNVIPALIIAIMGAIANTIFWRKYTNLNRTHPNTILMVQARLYRAKSFVDICVTVALLSVLAIPMSPISFWLDVIGSLIVSLYMLRCGVQTIWETSQSFTV